MARRKKKSNLFWYVIIGLVVAIALFVFLSGDAEVDVDFTQYDYTDSSLAKPNAAHTITEYSDFQCPACKSVVPLIRQVKTTLDVKVEYKHFPLSSIHPYAQRAAEAAECARDQDRFWAYHDVLFDNQENLGVGYLKKYAEGLGLDTDAFNSCFDDRKKQTVVASNFQQGELAGVRGTPTIFIDGELVQYRSYEQFKAHFE